MSRYLLARLFSALLVTCAVLAPVASLAQSAARNEGSKNYTPSRLEWLAMDFNSRARVSLSESSGYSIDFVPLERHDTLLIAVRYWPTANREAMNLELANARELIDMRVKYYGWSSWLKVREDIKIIETSKPR